MSSQSQSKLYLSSIYKEFQQKSLKKKTLAQNCDKNEEHNDFEKEKMMEELLEPIFIP